MFNVALMHAALHPKDLKDEAINLICEFAGNKLIGDNRRLPDCPKNFSHRDRASEISQND